MLNDGDRIPAATLTISDGSTINLALWGRNIFDKEYFVDSLNIFQALHANRMVRYGDPQTFGIELGFRY